MNELIAVTGPEPVQTAAGGQAPGVLRGCYRPAIRPTGPRVAGGGVRYTRTQTASQARLHRYRLSNNDSGLHVFSYTFNVLGFQTITVTDANNSSITGRVVVDMLAQTAGQGGPVCDASIKSRDSLREIPWRITVTCVVNPETERVAVGPIPA